MYCSPSPANKALGCYHSRCAAANWSSGNITSICGGYDILVPGRLSSVIAARYGGCHIGRQPPNIVEKILLSGFLRQQVHQSGGVVFADFITQGGLVKGFATRENGRFPHGLCRTSRITCKKGSSRHAVGRTPVFFVSSGDERQGIQGKVLLERSLKLTTASDPESAPEGVIIADVEAVKEELQDSSSCNSEYSGTVASSAEVAIVAFVEDIDSMRHRGYHSTHHQQQQPILNEEDEVDANCCNGRGLTRTRISTASLSQALTQATGRVLSYTVGAVSRPRGYALRGPSAIAFAVAAFAVVVGLASVVKAREDTQGIQRLCTTCSGRGVEACSVCGGEGHICWEGKCNRDTPCPACMGSGSQKCHSCHGIRRKRVPVQAGAVKVVEESLPL